MKKSKLLELIRALDEGELKRLQVFAESPYFNQRPELTELIRYLVGQAPEFPEEKVRKEKVFAELFNNVPFEEKQLAYLMNYGLQLVERFLAIEGFEQDTIAVNCRVLRQYIQRDLDKHYQFLRAKTEKLLEGRPRINAQYWYDRFQLADVESEHFIHQKERRFDLSLQRQADAFDDYYCFNKLRFGCGMRNLETIVSGAYRFPLMDEVRRHLREQEAAPPFHLEMYLQIYELYTSERPEANFQRLQDLIRRHGAAVDPQEMREIYLAAINYCARKIRSGDRSYYQNALELYLNGIETQALFEGAYLSHWTYTNVVKLALALKRFDWLEGFINEHSGSLPPATREDAMHFNLAELHFERHNFDEVLRHLSQLHFSDLQYHLSSRILLVKTYYELDEIESLLSLLASFTMFLRRNRKISVAMKKSLLNFCGQLHLILRSKPSKKERVKARIMETQPLVEKTWLLRVLEEQLG